MNLHIGSTLKHQTVILDHQHFIDSTLEDCILEYSGSSVIFERCILRRCRYVFFGPAKATVIFLQETGLKPFNQAEWAEEPELIH